MQPKKKLRSLLACESRDGRNAGGDSDLLKFPSDPTASVFFNIMTRDLFRRYVWLVDTVRHGHKMTFDEISHQWDISPLNDNHSQLALRTFHNHREAIELLFGIRILCDRSDHQYYIPENSADSTRLKIWMLQTLSISHLINRSSRDVENRIVLDSTPEEKFGVVTLLDAIHRNRVTTIVCSAPGIDGKTSFDVEPYCLRFWSNSWYLLARDIESGLLHGFEITRIISIRVSDQKFDYPENFNPRDFFNRFYGMDIEEELPVETIRVKVSGLSRALIRSMPIHHSQSEVIAGEEESVFEFRLAPTRGFINALLVMQTDVEVLDPESLRIHLRDAADSICRIYSDEQIE